MHVKNRENLSQAEDRKRRCLKHSNRFRSGFQFILNWLRNRNLSVSVAQVQKLVTCRCECSTTEPASENPFVGNIPEMKRIIVSFITGDTNINEMKRENLQQFIETVTTCTDLDPVGVMNFFTVVLASLNGQLRDLIPPATKSPDGRISKSVRVNIGAHLIGQLIGKGGSKINKICSKHQCKIMIKRTEMYEVKANIETRQTEANIEHAEKNLNQLAATVQDENNRWMSKIQARYAMRRKRREDRQFSQISFEKLYQDTKARGQQGLKTFPRGQRPPVMLSKSRCLHCQVPYDQRKDDKYKVCQYHPGYVKLVKEEKTWSCCGQNYKNSEGCTTGKQHNFRPTKFSPGQKGKGQQASKHHLDLKRWHQEEAEMSRSLYKLTMK